MGIPSRLINVGCMMPYMKYTPRTLEEVLEANPMPELQKEQEAVAGMCMERDTDENE